MAGTAPQRARFYDGQTAQAYEVNVRPTTNALASPVQVSKAGLTVSNSKSSAAARSMKRAPALRYAAAWQPLFSPPLAVGLLIAEPSP